MSEKSLHRAVCDYIRYQYKDCLFNTDLSGIRVTPGLAGQLSSLRSRNGFPDLILYEPRGKYYGLFLELKKEGTRLYKKNGQPADSHIADQLDCLLELRMRGYCVAFAVGFDNAKELIDSYLNGKL
jgi:hypothetical protein